MSAELHSDQHPGLDNQHSRLSPVVGGADPKPRYAFFLQWPIRTTVGGVNQVVLSLMRQFDSDSPLEPILIESDWGVTRPAEIPDPEFRCIRYRFRTPWEQTRPIRSLLGFIVSLPTHLRVCHKLLRDERIQVVNAHFPELDTLLFSILKMLRLYKGKIILSLHGSDIRSAYSGGWVRRQLWRALLSSVDSIVSCSEALGREVLPIAPNVADKLVTIHNGIDVEAFLKESEREDFPLPLALAGKRLITQIGQFSHRKGHDLLVEAFARIAGRYPDAALVLVGGPGSYLPDIKDKIAALNLRDRVVILESLSHAKVPLILQATEIVVLASRTGPPGTPGEGFPIITLEAAAVVKPVVSTRSCGATEILEDGKNARLVDPEDAAGLAEAIAELLDKPEFASSLAKELSHKVETSFTWKRAFTRYLQLC